MVVWRAISGPCFDRDAAIQVGFADVRNEPSDEMVRGRAGGSGADCWKRAGRSPPRAREQPNIVLIVADDLGWGDVGFNGRTEWSTPNLDRLAKQGRVFQRCYTAAVVCAPSRGHS